LIQLTIAVPTFNRMKKLDRLLNFIFSLENNYKIEVIVSDNFSTDNTESIASKYLDKGLIYYRQKSNIGFDSNVRFLYGASSGEYVWLVSDDDILFKNSIEKIIRILDLHSPDVLLYSFQQPKGSSEKIFNFENNPHIVYDKNEIIELVTRYPKITSFILKKINLSNKQLEGMEYTYESCYDFVGLAFTILDNNNPKLVIISDQLASADNDFHISRFPIEVWIGFWMVYKHPFVIKEAPKLWESKKDKSYYNSIDYTYSLVVKKIEQESKDDYFKAINSIKFHLIRLLISPKHLIKYLIIKKNNEN
jgi:glycosyltransferase involved in cell wall biosynthesis